MLKQNKTKLTKHFLLVLKIPGLGFFDAGVFALLIVGGATGDPAKQS